MNLPAPHLFSSVEAEQPARKIMHATPEQGSDMPVQRIVPRLAMSIACGIAVQSSPAFAENRGTFEQQMACTPDVFRLCGEMIPDTDRIVVCLRQNTPQLSGPCRAVFQSNASAPDPAAARRRSDRSKTYDDQ
jgi:hypothetical protein